MALNTAKIGHTYPDTPPYEVSREKIREFADAIGDASPVCRDRAAAQATGYRDVVAPPTFLTVISLPARRQAGYDPEIGIDYSKVVHGEEHFEHHQPVCAGDVVTARVTILDIRPAGKNWLLTAATKLHRVPDDELICTATSTMVVRGENA